MREATIYWDGKEFTVKGVEIYIDTEEYGDDYITVDGVISEVERV